MDRGGRNKEELCSKIPTQKIITFIRCVYTHIIKTIITINLCLKTLIYTPFWHVLQIKYTIVCIHEKKNALQSNRPYLYWIFKYVWKIVYTENLAMVRRHVPSCYWEHTRENALHYMHGGVVWNLKENNVYIYNYIGIVVRRLTVLCDGIFGKCILYRVHWWLSRKCDGRGFPNVWKSSLWVDDARACCREGVKRVRALPVGPYIYYRLNLTRRLNETIWVCERWPRRRRRPTTGLGACVSDI